MGSQRVGHDLATQQQHNNILPMAPCIEFKGCPIRYLTGESGGKEGSGKSSGDPLWRSWIPPLRPLPQKTLGKPLQFSLISPMNKWWFGFLLPSLVENILSRVWLTHLANDLRLLHLYVLEWGCLVKWAVQMLFFRGKGTAWAILMDENFVEGWLQPVDEHRATGSQNYDKMGNFIF